MDPAAASVFAPRFGYIPGMRRVLLLMSTTTYRAGAFLDAARRIGIPVTVGSERAQALEWANPVGHLTLDITDARRSLPAIEDFARGCPVGAVLAADDDGAELAARAAHVLGLAHHPVTAVAATRDKHRMRERFAAAGLPTPRFERVSTADDTGAIAARIHFPCVVKPLWLGASRGVTRADTPAELERALERVAHLLRAERGRTGFPRDAEPVLIEDYLPGVEVALEGLVTAGRMRTLALFDKPDPLEGPYFEETIYVTPSRLPRLTQHAIEQRAGDMAAALGLAHGPVHAELRVNDHGVWPLEIAPRSIGGLCSRALRFAGGASLEELILRHALGMPGADAEREPEASGVMMIPIPHAGTLRGVTGVAEARRVPDIEDVRITIPIGDSLVPLPEGSRYLGFIFARGLSPGRVEDALRSAHRLLTFDIETPRAEPREAGRT